MNNLQEGIAAVKAGDKARAFQLLTRATQDSATAEQAWLWLSATVDQDAEKLYCLDNALRINRDNAAAQKAAAMLRQKGILPAVPLGPEHPLEALPQISFPLAVEPVPAKVAAKPQAPGPGAAPAMSQEMSSLVKYTAAELSRKTPPQVVVKNLVNMGLSSEGAARIVAQTQQSSKRIRAEKGKKQMIAGILWAVGGIAATVLSRYFMQGSFVVFYGAVVYGVIDFFVGLVSWLSSR